MGDVRVRGDFNGLFGDLLCLSHKETCLDETGAEVRLAAGMRLTAFEPDVDDAGNPDDLMATGTVEPAPDWLQCKGSKWVLRLDERGAYHQSDAVSGH